MDILEYLGHFLIAFAAGVYLIERSMRSKSRKTPKSAQLDEPAPPDAQRAGPSRPHEPAGASDEAHAPRPSGPRFEAVRVSPAFLALGLVLCVIGGFGVLCCAMEPEAVEVDVVALERGEASPSPVITFGLHMRYYRALIFVRARDLTGKKKSWWPLRCAYYPVLSPEHPFWRSLYELHVKHGHLKNAPITELPDLGHVGIFVRTTRFETIGDLPKDPGEMAESFTGSVIAAREEIHPSEWAGLVRQFPDVDLDSVVFLAEGDEPTSFTTSLWLLLGGVACLAWAVSYCFVE